MNNNYLEFDTRPPIVGPSVAADAACTPARRPENTQSASARPLTYLFEQIPTAVRPAAYVLFPGDGCTGPCHDPFRDRKRFFNTQARWRSSLLSNHLILIDRPALTTEHLLPASSEPVPPPLSRPPPYTRLPPPSPPTPPRR